METKTLANAVDEFAEMAARASAPPVVKPEPIWLVCLESMFGSAAIGTAEIVERLRAEFSVRELDFRGTCRGCTPDVSFSEGYYSTVHGEMEYYRWSTLRIGDEVDYDGRTWVVVHNVGKSGNMCCPATHKLVLVPVDELHGRA
ncbi:MAG: hypothetical protein WC773_01080 [Patescibacteria group bacterium]